MNHGQFTARDSRVLRPGFTFVELLCVLIVLGMIAAVAVPRYANAITRGRVEAAARRITTDLALAQRTAKFTGKSRKVAFDPFLDKYYMPSIRDPDHFSEAYQVFLGDEPYNTAMISADFNGDGDLIFDGHGVPDSGGTVIIGP